MPETILEEVATLADLDAGGHKVFAGPDEDYLGRHLYFNVNFKFDGTGTFEAFPPNSKGGRMVVHPTVRHKGTFDWQPSGDNRKLEMVVTGFIEGGISSMGDIDFDAVERQDDGVGLLVSGATQLKERYISRIIKHSDC